MSKPCFSGTPVVAEPAGGVAGPLEHRGDGLFAGAQGRAAAVLPHRNVAHVLAGHQRAARRGADRAAGQGLGEANPFGRHAIDVGRLQLWVAHARKFVIGQLVRHHVDDVRLAALDVRGGKRRRRENDGENKKRH